MSDPLGLFGNQEDPLGLDPLGLFKSNTPTAFQSFVSGAKGTAAAVGDIAGGLVKIPVQAALAVGGKIADPSTSLQSTWESAGKAVEDTYPAFGKGMEENVGYTAPMKPFELYGEGAQYVAKKASMGNKDVEGAINIGANFLPIPFVGKAGKVAGKVIEQVDPGLRRMGKETPVQGPNLAGIAAETAPTPAVKAPEAPIVDTRPGIQKTQEAYQAALREKELAQQSAFNRPDTLPELTQRQSPMERMASDLGAEPIPVSPDSPMSRMAKTLEEGSTKEQRAAQDAVALRQKALEDAVAKQTSLDMGASERARQEAADTVSKAHQDWMDAQAEAQRVADTARMEQATQPEMFEGPDQGYGPNPYDIGGEQHWVKDENGMPIRADLSMEAQNLENPNQMNLWGDELAPKHELELTKMPPLGSMARSALRGRQGGALFIGEPKPREILNELGITKKHTTLFDKIKQMEAKDSNLVNDPSLVSAGQRSAYTKARSNLFNSLEESGIPVARGYSELNRAFDTTTGSIKSPGNRQSGKILFPFGQKKVRDTLAKVEGIKEHIGDVAPDQRPVEQFLKEEAGKADVSQNFAQKVSNYFTKGSAYQAIKTGNPIIKRVSDTIVRATRETNGQIASYVHERLAPAAQKLSNQEKADVWAAQTIAEKNGKPLTRELMEKHGFNENQIAWVETHGDVMKDMMTKMNEVMAATGQKPVSARVAYLASRASGDFRRLVYKEVKKPDGTVERTPVSILGANTSSRLKADAEKLQAAHPEWVIGEEKYYGGSSAKGNATEGFTAMLDLISKDNPDVRLLADHVNEILSKDAFNYMNAKTHTMAKKGITGMEGRKELSNAVENARDGMQAQINYAERMIEWANMSKAVQELKPILHKTNGLDMPNAKAWSEDYVQHALGNNPGLVGKHLDQALAAAFEKAGVGPSIMRQIPAKAKSFVNGILLGFGNIGFMAMNLVQPFTSSPAMMAFLKGRGLEKSFDAGTGYRYLGDAINTAWNDLNGGTLSPVEKGAFEYAKKNHVYSSDLFDASNKATKDFGHYWDKGIQIGAGAIEMRTRQIAFLSYVKLLHENGMTKEKGLYETAHNLTDLQMNNYSPVEMPKVYTEMLGKTVGSMPANLMSYKHNELSRLAMMVNEIGRSKTAAPLLTHIASSLAFAGVLGTIGYAEADAIVKLISKLNGTPTSLTKILLDNPEIPEQLKYGVGSNVGIDLTSRLATGALVPGHVIDAIMPGAGKIVNIATAGAEAIMKPSEFNTKNFVRELAPNSVAGVLDRSWFSKDNAKGEEMSISRTTGKPIGDVRNEADKVWKTLGLTGMHEAKEKSKLWENAQINKWYADKQKSVVEQATKQFAMDSTIPKDFATKFIKVQGDPATLESLLNKMIFEGSVDQKTAQTLYNATAGTIASTHKLLRLQGQE